MEELQFSISGLPAEKLGILLDEFKKSEEWIFMELRGRGPEMKRGLQFKARLKRNTLRAITSKKFIRKALLAILKALLGATVGVTVTITIYIANNITIVKNGNDVEIHFREEPTIKGSIENVIKDLDVHDPDEGG